MSDVIVFASESETLTATDSQQDVLVVKDATPAATIQQGTGDTFVLVDPPITSSKVTTPPSEFVVFAEPVDRIAVDANTGVEVFEVISGGPKGDKGDKGDTGPATPLYYQEFGFAVASATWTIAHNQNTYGLSVVTLDLNGDVVEGNVEYPDMNTIVVYWYSAMSGTARVYN